MLQGSHGHGRAPHPKRFHGGWGAFKVLFVKEFWHQHELDGVAGRDGDHNGHVGTRKSIAAPAELLQGCHGSRTRTSHSIGGSTTSSY